MRNLSCFRKPTGRLHTGVFLIAALAVWASSSRAANLWDGGGSDDSWSTSANWDDDAVPTFPASLTFGGSARLSPSNDLTDVALSGLDFAAASGAFTLLGNGVTLSGNVGVAAGGSTTNNQTVSMPLALSADATFSAAPAGGSTSSAKGALVLNGIISGPHTVTSAGRNYVQFNATNTYTGGTTIMAASGDTSVSLGCDNPFGTGLVTFGSFAGAPQQWVVASGGDRVLTNDVRINTSLFIAHNATVAGKSPGSLTLAGNVFLKTSSSFYNNANNLTLAGPVSGGAPGNIFELRAGKLSLAGLNTFTNTISITNPGYGPGRTLNINSDTALGHTNNGIRFTTGATLQLTAATALTLAPSRVIDIYAGKTALFDIPSDSSLTVSGPVTNGGAVAKSGGGAMTLAGSNTFSGGTYLYNGMLSVPHDAGLGAIPASPSRNLFFNSSSASFGAGANHALAANRTVWIGTNVVATFNTLGYTQTVNGVIESSPGSWIAKAGEGELVLDPGTEATNIVSSLRSLKGTLSVRSGTLLVTSNTVWSTYPIYDILHVNGGEVLVGGGQLATTGDGYASIQNGALTVTNGLVDLTSLRELLNAYAGTGNTTVQDNGILDVQVLRITQSGTPAISNVVNVNAGGTIRLKNFNIDTGYNAPYGTVNLNGGTLEAKATTDGFMGYNVGKWTTNVFFYVREGGAVIDSGTNTIAVQSPLYSGSPEDGGLTKKGPGMLTLANTNTYTGLTTVDAGTLRINVANALLPGNDVFVASGAVLDLTGKIQTLDTLGGSGLVTNNSQLSVTGAIQPGGTNAVGQLTLAATPASLDGTMYVDIGTGGSSDRLAVQADLDLTGLALTLVNPGDLEKHAQYVVASCSGTLTAPFLSAAIPPRWHLTYDGAGGEVRLSYNFGTLFSLR